MSTQYIKAPYNFVPLSEQVVYPEWADFISHDVPFEDEQSGTLTVKIKTHSDIYVRQGGAKKEDKNTNFSQHDGQYFIPGSSVKGAIRNVLEIMTFSRMGRKVQDNRYAIRDLSKGAKAIYRDFFNVSNTYAGWLFKNNENKYQLLDCGIPGRISHEKIDDFFGSDFEPFFGAKGSFDEKNDEEKKAIFKYDRLNKNVSDLNFEFIKKDNPGRDIFEIEELATEKTKKGTLVFTGQPDRRKLNPKTKKYQGKYYEFVFFDSKYEKDIPDNVIKDFLFAYPEDNSPSRDNNVKTWKEKLNSGEKIPVFFHKEGGEVTALGLSYLFKLPYRNSVEEALPSDHKSLDVDFSEALFGFINEQQDNDSLKGRVHFSPAFVRQETALPGKLKKEVLSSPKASYYPNYIRQSLDKNGKVKGQYLTFMDDKASLAGWKRYPIRKGKEKNNVKPVNASEDILTTFIPLQAGAEFEFKIRYHNLRSVELGALLSVLTFHNTKKTFHSIGMAKPLGYGKVSFELEGIDNAEEHMRAFEAYMEAKGIKHWSQSEQICELISMSSEPNSDAHLGYMKLDTKGNNDFTKAKKAGEALDIYSNLHGVTKRGVNTLLISREDDIKKASQDIDRWKNIGKDQEERLVQLENTKNSFEAQLELAKKEMLKKIHDRREELRIDERKIKQAEAAKTANEAGPGWNELDLTHRDAFRNLKKVIELFVQKLNKGTNYDKLKKAAETPLLPEKFHEELKGKLRVIFEHLNSKNKKKWRKEDNADQKKVAEWIGKESAFRFFKQL